jgi:hypothetical protein
MSCVSAGLAEALSGAQAPTFHLAPAAAHGFEADDAIELASRYGLVPDEWQALVLRDWLGVRDDGRWAATRCGLAVPRQNGKNGILEMRELYGMVLRGESFLHTAHEVKTARKAYKRLLSFFDDDVVPPKFPELTALVVEIRRANGQEAIYLSNGGSVEVISRSKGSGRGFTVDVIVVDEAQELSDDDFAALTPTRSAAPLKNPQLIFTGTPPSPSMSGDVFTRIRAAGLKGDDPRLSWHSWECSEDADLDSPEAAALSNPALGGRVSYESVADERADMDDETFARERLGVWASNTADRWLVIPHAKWAARAGAEGRPDGPVAFALSASWPNAETGAIAVAGYKGGQVYVQVVEHRPGTSWMPARMKQLQDEHKPVVVVLDDRDPAKCEKQALKDAGVQLRSLTTLEATEAYGMFIAAVMGDTPYLWHYDQPELNNAVASADNRPVGDAHTWMRKGPHDISPLVAGTDAAYGLAVTPAYPPPDIL